MPPTLDLSRTAHSQVIVSPARINLRRAASYTHEKGPLSSTSSRFNFNHLLFASPPPSPGLPQLVTRRRKPSTAPRPSRVFRLAMWAFGILVVVYVAALSLRAKAAPAPTWSRRTDDEYEMIGQDDLPDFPTPILVTDSRGKAKWTVSIPPNHDFPLSAREYSDICSKCREVADRVRFMNHEHLGSQPDSPSGGRNQLDRHFIDVREAENAGYLPGSVSIGALLSQQRHAGDLIGEDKGSLVDKPVCSSSMTFVLASADAGMGQTLMLLWMSYALAQTQRRAFFIDDTRWAYGTYTDIFAAPPIPHCRPPCATKCCPVPRQSRHLVVTAQTAREIFDEEDAVVDVDGGGGGGGDDVNDPSSARALFDLARRGCEDLFVLNKHDADYVSGRVAELAAKKKIRGMAGKGRHDRRHARAPRRPAPARVPVPRLVRAMNTYTVEGPRDPQRHLLRRRPHLQRGVQGPLAGRGGVGRPAGVRVGRVRRRGAGAGTDPPGEQVGHPAGQPGQERHTEVVDATFGWEGGFFAAMFWNLGLSTLSAANAGPRAGQGRPAALGRDACGCAVWSAAPT